MSDKTVRIGGASGYWGDSAMATPQFLNGGDVQYIVYDYLAEITMSIMARAKAKDPTKGYATDFVSAVLHPHLPQIAEKGVKLVANAGGVNPEACGTAVREVIKKLGLDLRVAVITGDDLLPQKEDIAASNPVEMFSNEAFPDPAKVASINAYIGAFPIAEALSKGADIVITGRCVDSAVTLGICIHEFGWQADDWDSLASGSLAGHILECGTQATGGNYTDWELAGDIAEIGYPIAEIEADGSFEVTKPEGTSGIVSVGTVSEQMLYEIGDPQDYILPDVICDFSHVEITEAGPNRVRVGKAKGYPAPDMYKTCATYADGFRTGATMSFYGFDAARKAQAFADAAFARTRKVFRKFNAGDFTETSVEIIGAESQFGEYGSANDAREVIVKIAAKHPDMMGAGLLLKEMAGLGLATPPGLSGFSGGRPKPSPVIRLFSYLTPKEDVTVRIDMDGEVSEFTSASSLDISEQRSISPALPADPTQTDNTVEVPLIKLAWGRSGDKGDKANVGIIARDAAYMPYIWQTLTEESVASRFAHFIDDKDSNPVQRFYLPGSNAINFLIDNVLGGGGVASIRNDPQGKGYAQILLAHPVSIPAKMAEAL
ncbi:MAG: DUF1446 domain-containing protein [Aquisalinus sp.]|nr:DUF1446 domain-containing protein [Aquisalinus sp.]